MRSNTARVSETGDRLILSEICKRRVQRKHLPADVQWQFSFCARFFVALAQAGFQLVFGHVPKPGGVFVCGEVTGHCSLGTQELLARAEPRAIREEVRRLKRELGADGGYILEPGITIQADVPLENVLALIEAARQSEAGAG